MAKNPISARLDGFDETRALLKTLGGEAEKGLQALVARTAIRVQVDAVRSIQRGPKTGRVYRRGSVTHRASAPGQPPATDTGALASSVARVDGKLEAAVGTGLEYGKHLEFGTSTIKARPWLIPALEKNREFFREGVKKLLEKAAKDGVRQAAVLVARLRRMK